MMWISKTQVSVAEPERFEGGNRGQAVLQPAQVPQQLLLLGPGGTEGLWQPGFWLGAAEGLLECSQLVLGWLKAVLFPVPY